MLAGGVVVSAILVRAGCRRLGVPALVGHLLLGFAGALANAAWDLFGAHALGVFELLAGIGIVCILFRVGLEVDKPALVSQLGRAVWIWVGNVGLSAVAGYVTARYLLDFELIPSLFVAVALSVTSVGVSVEVWREVGALRTRAAGLLVDIAELDDITGVALLAVLLAIAPVLAGGGGSLLPLIGLTGVTVAGKALLFFAFCLVFARYLERPITGFFRRVEPAPSPMMLVVASGVMIAAVADWLGFTLAIGALFAGLIFSRDPEAVKRDASFTAIYDLFAPFFFIHIGLTLDVAALGVGVGAGLALLIAGVVGKVLGTAAPALRSTGLHGAIVLGVSMVPRAEIAMVIMSEGRKLGAWAVPPEAFTAVVVMAAATSLVAPIVVRALIKRWSELMGDGPSMNTDDERRTPG